MHSLRPPPLLKLDNIVLLFATVNLWFGTEILKFFDKVNIFLLLKLFWQSSGNAAQLFSWKVKSKILQTKKTSAEENKFGKKQVTWQLLESRNFKTQEISKIPGKKKMRPPPDEFEKRNRKVYTITLVDCRCQKTNREKILKTLEGSVEKAALKLASLLYIEKICCLLVAFRCYIQFF